LKPNLFSSRFFRHARKVNSWSAAIRKTINTQGKAPKPRNSYGTFDKSAENIDIAFKMSRGTRGIASGTRTAIEINERIERLRWVVTVCPLGRNKRMAQAAKGKPSKKSGSHCPREKKN